MPVILIVQTGRKTPGFTWSRCQMQTARPWQRQTLDFQYYTVDPSVSLRMNLPKLKMCKGLIGHGVRGILLHIALNTIEAKLAIHLACVAMTGFNS